VKKNDGERGREGERETRGTPDFPQKKDEREMEGNGETVKLLKTKDRETRGHGKK